MRRLLALVSAIVFVDAMLFGALTPLVPGYADEFGLSKTGAGLLVGAFGAGALLGGIPGGLAATRFGPKRAVLAGLLLLAAGSFVFAAAGNALTLGVARFVQGFSSTVTWAGALAWIAVVAPRSRRGEVIGTAFGAAVAGAVLGPMFGGVADLVGIRLAFTVVGVATLAFAAFAGLARAAPAQASLPGSLGRAFADARFLGGLWLQALPAMLFGVLLVLAPLALDDLGWSALAIATVFFVAGIAEVVLNPLLGRATDRVGRLFPIRVALAASIVVALGLAAGTRALVIATLVCAAAVTFGALYTPSMALASHRAESAGLAQGLAFGVVGSAWALGELTGPAVGGALADSYGDPVPYVLGATLCALTLTATYAVTTRRARPHAA